MKLGTPFQTDLFQSDLLDLSGWLIYGLDRLSCLHPTINWHNTCYHGILILIQEPVWITGESR